MINVSAAFYVCHISVYIHTPAILCVAMQDLIWHVRLSVSLDLSSKS